MTTLEINGKDIEVDDGFMSLTPDEQNKTIEEIAQQMGLATDLGTVERDTKADLGGASTEALGTDYSGRINPVMSAIWGAAEIPAMGFLDEMAAGAAAIVKGFDSTDERSFSERYQDELAMVRNATRTSMEENPVSHIGGNIAGIVGTAGALGPVGLVSRAPTAATRIGAGALEGGAFGAVTGYGMGTGDNRMESAGKGALTGAGLGLGIGVGFEGVRKAAGLLGRVLNTSSNKANDAIKKALEADGLTVKQAAKRLAEMKQYSPRASLVDVAGENTRNLLRTATNFPNKMQNVLRANLDIRQYNQPMRISKALGIALGDAEDYFMTLEALKDARALKAEPLFQNAFKVPVHFSRELEKVLERPAVRAAMKLAKIGRLNRGEGPDFKQIFAREISPGQYEYMAVPGLEDLHHIKVKLDDVIRSMRKGQETSLKNMSIRDIRIAKKALVEAINRPDYKKALREFAGDSAVINAIEDGADFLKKSPEEIRELLSDYSTAETEMFRLGAARALVDKIEGPSAMTDKIKAIFQSPGMIKRIKAIFPELKSVRQLQKAFVYEGKFVASRAAVQGNSTTAKQLIGLQESGADMATIAEAASRLARADVAGAIASFGRRSLARISGIGEKTAAELVAVLGGQGSDVGAIMQALQARGINVAQKQLQSMTVQDVLTMASGMSAGTVAAD